MRTDQQVAVVGRLTGKISVRRAAELNCRHCIPFVVSYELFCVLAKPKEQIL